MSDPHVPEVKVGLPPCTLGPPRKGIRFWLILASLVVSLFLAILESVSQFSYMYIMRSHRLIGRDCHCPTHNRRRPSRHSILMDSQCIRINVHCAAPAKRWTGRGMYRSLDVRFAGNLSVCLLMLRRSLGAAPSCLSRSSSSRLVVQLEELPRAWKCSLLPGVRP